MQAIAAENNLAETAFVEGKGARPALVYAGVDAAVRACDAGGAHAIFSHPKFDGPEIGFDTKSGRLTVKRLADGRLEMDFPADPSGQMRRRCWRMPGAAPKEVWAAVSAGGVRSAAEIRVKPDPSKIAGRRRMFAARRWAITDSLGARRGLRLQADDPKTGWHTA
jgi:predicted PhzF superfamily epimerase YddE/YHI9